MKERTDYQPKRCFSAFWAVVITLVLLPCMSIRVHAQGVNDLMLNYSVTQSLLVPGDETTVLVSLANYNAAMEGVVGLQIAVDWDLNEFEIVGSPTTELSTTTAVVLMSSNTTTGVSFIYGAALSNPLEKGKTDLFSFKLKAKSVSSDVYYTLGVTTFNVGGVTGANDGLGQIGTPPTIHIDVTYPTVSSVLPSGPGAAIRDDYVVITFSEEMDPGTIGTVQLNSLPALSGGSWSAGNTVYSVAYSGLTNNTAYTVNISGFKDVVGYTMTADGFNSFTTVAATPVTFTALQTGGTVNTTNTTGIELTFDVAVSNLEIGKITITNGTGDITTSTLSGSGTTWTVVVTNVTTQGDVTVSVADFDTYTVTTPAQTVAVYKDIPPTVVSVTPNGSAEPISGNVVITFSKAMDATPGTGTVQLNSLPALSGGSWSAGNTVYTVAYSGLTNNTAYAVNISDFKDAAGNTMTVDNSKSFTTAVATPVTFTALQTGGTVNTTNTTGIELTFSPAVTNLEIGKITITNGTGDIATSTLSGSGTTWTVVVTNVTTQGDVTVSVADFDTYTVTTTAQTVAVYKDNPPTVVSVTPSGSAEPISGNVVITFSEAMDPAVTGTVTLTGGASTMGADAWSAGNTVYTIAYSSLANSILYTISISGFKDVTGNTMAANASNIFTTVAPAPTNITITNVDQIGGSSNTATSTGIELEFSASVTGLTAGDITISNGTGAAVKGSTLTGSGTTWTIELTSVTAEGNVNVAVANFPGFNVTNSPQIVAVYKDGIPPSLSAGSVIRTTPTAATIGFTSSEAGTAYYLVQNAGDAAPANTAVKAGTLIGSVTTIPITGIPVGLTAGPKDIYVVVEDAEGNLSSALPITAAADIGDATVTQSVALTYDATAQSPTFCVSFDGGVTCLSTTDYTVTVTPQTYAGTYTGTDAATITGNGVYYTGTTTAAFTIDKAQVTVTQGTYTISKDYDGTVSAVGAGMIITGALSITGIFDATTVILSPGVYPSADVGTYNITYGLTLSDDANHELVSNTLIITNAAINKATFGTQTVYANVPDAGSSNNTVLLPALAPGASYPTNAPAGTPFITGTLPITPAGAGLMLEFDASPNAGGTETISILVTGGTNYNDYYVDVIVTWLAVMKENQPAASIDFTNELFINLVANADYLVDGTPYTSDASGSIPIQAGWIGGSNAIIKVGVGGNAQSDPQSITVPTRPAAPAATKTDTSGGLNNGEINTVDATMAYKLGSAAIWIDISGTDVTGLAAGTYEVRYKATLSDFASNITTLTIASSLPPFTAPTAPQNFTATPGDGQVTLTWSAPASDGGSPITSYQVSSNNGATWVTASSNTSHTFTGLTNGTSYTFQVRAVNAAGAGAAASATTTPLAPVTSAGYTIYLSTTGGGRISSNKTYAFEDDEIFIILTPDPGYLLVSITADALLPNTLIELSGKGNGSNGSTSRTFIMPASTVLISAVFKKQLTAWEEAQKLISEADFSVLQNEANTVKDLRYRLTDLINELISCTGFYIYPEEVVIFAFTAAQEGTFDNKDGTDGSFEFRVSPSIANNSVYNDGTIVATNYDQVANEALRNGTLKAWAFGGVLYVTGLTPDTSWTVYNLTGQAIFTGIANNYEEKIMLSERGIYIVTNGKKIVKVVN